MPALQEQTCLQSIDQLTEDIFRLTLTAPQIARKAKPGQFVMVKTTAGFDPLLRRPFSIHDRPDKETIVLLFKAIGKGTMLLGAIQAGQAVDLVGPMGNNFHYNGNKRYCLIGGGMGIAPLLFLARQLQEYENVPPSILLGAQTAEELHPLIGDFNVLGCNPQVSTDDGSLGHCGYVSELLPPLLTEVDEVCVCGPTPLMAKVAQLCAVAAIPCQSSLETHMACGLGACLGCTVHGHDATYLHVCKHGPVFDATQIQWVR
ncbi:MAG: oxidoreductase [Desulfobacterales bacterium]|nr:MAG: oxidoreductase [Desulfobacterales bacterium]